MKWLQGLRVPRLYGYSKRMYSNLHCNCNASTYLLSPFSASLLTGCLFSVTIKEHVSNELLYIKRQNEEIIARLKRLEKKDM
jgi:hypothetical protein